MTKSLVTGGAGFIGSHLVDLLLTKGQRVCVVDNFVGGHRSNIEKHLDDPNFELIEQDICSLPAASSIFSGVDCCFHLAGIGDIVPSIEAPAEYMHTNVQGTVNVLEAARHYDVKRFVYAASSSCYGLAQTPTDEEHPLDTRYPYALSKFLGEQAVFHWGKVYGMQTNSICIFNAYGTRVRTTGAYGAVFGVFLKQLLAGSPFTVVGNGEQKRDFVYVTDVANAFYLASQCESVGHRFNVGGGDPKSINELVALLGKNDIEFVPRRPGEPDETFANIKKSKDLLGWRPVVNFEQGVSLMLEDLDQWANAPLWTSESINEATKTWFKYLK